MVMLSCVVYNKRMITNITTQSFADFAKTVEEKVVQNPQRQRLDTLASYYTDRVSANETELITKYADALVSGQQPHTPDPRLYMRRDLLGLVQDSYALGIADALVDLEDVQFSYEKTDAEFALSPEDKLQRDIQKLQRDIQASQQIVRQTKTLNQYTNTLQALQQQAQALNNTQATQTLTGLSEDLQRLKTGSTVRAATRVINQQLDKGNKQRQNIVDKIDADVSNAQKVPTEDELTGQRMRVDTTPDTQDYLVKRAIEEKLKYLQNRKDALAETPPVVLDEDTDFFRWYTDKRLVPIANRYQMGLEDKNNEAKKIVADYTEKINAGTINQTARGAYTDKVVRKILNIEDEAYDYEDQKSIALQKQIGRYVPPEKRKPVFATRPIKRVQRVVATELAIAYNVGRLKAYIKAGVQYVTISTSNYSTNKCEYCLDTEAKSIDNPISIASLLKRAYKNEGFDKSLNRPIEQRYLVSHPMCYCFYKPHPKQDPKEDGDSTGIYGDPNAWKFLLGAGLGVSLVFLAFALTTGRKISMPTTIPTGLPIRVPQAIPTIVSDVQPQSIPVIAKPTQPIALPPSQLDPVKIPFLRTIVSKLNPDELQDLAFIVNNPSLSPNEKLAVIFDIGASKGATVPNTSEEFTQTLETIVQQVVKGSRRKFLQEQTSRVRQTYDRNTQALGLRIAQEQAKAQAIDPQNPTKSTIAGISNSIKNINKTFIQSQLKSIQKTKEIVADSYNKVADKTKPNDIKYKEELTQTLENLSSMESALLEQRRVIGSIQEYLNDLVIPTKAVVRKATKAVIQQQLVRTTAAVDRLLDGSVMPKGLDKIRQATYIQEAQQQYEKLLEVLVDLPPKDIAVYQKRIQDLKRRIEKAQGVELKRFTGNIVGFSSITQRKYSC